MGQNAGSKLSTNRIHPWFPQASIQLTSIKTKRDNRKSAIFVSPPCSYQKEAAGPEAWLRLVLQEPHLVAASVGFERRVVAAAEVLFALEGRRLAQGTRQTQGLRAVFALPCEAPELSANERCYRFNLDENSNEKVYSGST